MSEHENDYLEQRCDRFRANLFGELVRLAGEGPLDQYHSDLYRDAQTIDQLFTVENLQKSQWPTELTYIVRQHGTHLYVDQTWAESCLNAFKGDRMILHRISIDEQAPKGSETYVPSTLNAGCFTFEHFTPQRWMNKYPEEITYKERETR